jgi:hypothetical protein
LLVASTKMAGKTFVSGSIYKNKNRHTSLRSNWHLSNRARRITQVLLTTSRNYLKRCKTRWHFLRII